MKKRNYGIDLLRIIAMFFVVIIHILGQGGVVETVADDKGKFAIAWFLYIIVYCAVNCYALITGFVCFSEEDKPHKFSNYIVLWLQVEFYSVLITFLFWKLYPKLVGTNQLLASFLPVTARNYWYFTAYTGVFLAMPWLNKIVQKLEVENLRAFMIGIFTFSLYVTIADLIGKDLFYLESGLSALWLAILYIIGAYIKKCELHKKVKIKNMGLIGILLVILTWGWKIGVGELTRVLVGNEIGSNFLFSFVSPTILGIAIVMLLIFANLEIKETAQKIIQFLSPAVFGVYLFHVHPVINSYVITDRYADIGNLSLFQIPMAILGSAAVVFIIGVLIDKIRIVLFKILRIDNVAIYVEKNIRKILKG